jgi:hypothetical protein
MVETFGVEEAVEYIFRADEFGEEQESDADIGFREQISKSEPNRIGIEKNSSNYIYKRGLCT